MANPIQFTDNVIATFQDREAVLLYVVTKFNDGPDGAALTTSDLATLEEIAYEAGTPAEMLALFAAKIPMPVTAGA